MPLPSRATVASRKANAMKTREAPSVKKKDAAAAQGALVAVEGVTVQRVPSSGFELMVRLRVGHATRGAASRAPSSAAEWLRCEGSGAKFADLAAVVSARARRQRAGHSNDVFYGGVGRCGDWDALVVAYDPSRRLAIRIATLEEGDVRLKWISTGAYMEYWSVFVNDGIDVCLDLCAGSCRAATWMARLLDVDKVIAIDVTSKFRDLAEKKNFFGDDDPADSKVELIKADLMDDFFLPSLIRKFRIRRIVMIFATPLCTANSDANTRLRAGGRAEGRATREGDRLLEACLEVYSASARCQEVPPVFFLENPWGNKSKSLPNRVAKHVANPRAQRHLHDLAELPCEKVHQCRYGGESWKPTAIWHNLGAGGLALERCEGRDRCPYFLRHGQHETNVQERGRARSQILPDALLQAIIGQGAARLPSPSRVTTSTN